ncbi:hypothetical protein [Helicobacter rodentium]|uniref:hypothetical protein n=1 Tax=Helicobacter rodentium TaxID=59617 RepID=UPI000AD1DBA2|nr:hypothetical protein [Helicobacter rodentium]
MIILKPSDILVFDLDGTLMRTDTANNLAYCSAIDNVTKSSLSLFVAIKELL